MTLIMLVIGHERTNNVRARVRQCLFRSERWPGHGTAIGSATAGRCSCTHRLGALNMPLAMGGGQLC